MVGALLLIVVGFMTIQGCLSDETPKTFFQKFCDDAENCADYELGERLREIKFLPTTEQELDAYCPSVTKMMWCIVQECAGKNIFCSNTPSNMSDNSITSALNVGGILLEICTYGSQLRQKYLSDISCIKKVMLTDDKTSYKCLVEGYQVIIASKLSVDGVSEEDRKKDTYCLSVLNTFTCLIAQTERTCGREASNTVQEFFAKINLLKWLNCNEDHMYELKTKLLRSRILGKEREEIFSIFY
ncbi:uncharacterized protein LOC129983593 [Argiope bruennichi]|uniref:uncharacterized protein LOC129983593 n=1 Tax=Argiope bruennichi TaxID=94029 RepID=UPI0024951B7B|nr:uncharacterized protein LOC129983593 [Argiope bruennichi]